MHPTTKTFRSRRARLGLTLAEVARLTGEPLDSVKQWSRGRYKVPAAVLRCLAMERLRRILTARLSRYNRPETQPDDSPTWTPSTNTNSPAPRSRPSGGRRKNTVRTPTVAGPLKD